MTWPHPSTHPTTHPPTKPHTHPWVGNSSQISNLQTELKYLDKLKCYWILSDSGGPPPWGGGRWVDGGGGRYGCVGGCPMHVRTHTRTHARTCMLNMLNMDASMLAAICNSIHVCVCVCVRARACACMCVHVGTPPHAPRYPQTPPPPTCPLPRAAGSPKHQISITLELIKIIRFCLKILYLWTFLNSYRL